MVKLLGKVIAIASILFIASCQSPNQIEPFFAAPVTDNSVVVAVNDAIHSDKHLANLPIQVQVANGVVVLSGYVKTIRQSDTAAEIASKVKGVQSVQNNLIVRK
ncbi:osmotically inducible protein Y- like protein [Legionella adelaidensis]|uniref:Osmotically inducible protein Y-like protein n=1 Tax=Legionella adelaidensis TaxID=45056 RepID=A0A0W0R6A4_9GAMM|nr:BON domain-containing protein [Legionella adelaidensis]KTC66609.1 osmotically inducible protein Y- like protein [Legionella adelaidensis]